jgi:hypothetical protein
MAILTWASSSPDRESVESRPFRTFRPIAKNERGAPGTAD